MAPKVVGVLSLAILGFPLGSRETKSHSDVGPMDNHKIYYKGEGGGFPQVWAMVSFVCSSCPWLVLARKVLQLCTKHLVLVCAGPSEQLKPINSSQSHLRTSTCPSALQSATRQGVCPDSLFFRCFLFGFSFESFKELGVRHLCKQEHKFP